MGAFCRYGVRGQVGTGEIGVAGKGGARLAVDEEAHLGDAGQVGMEGGDDGLDGEDFGFNAGRMAGGKAAGQVDHG